MAPRTISPDLKRAAVRMSRVFPVPIVATLLDISSDTVHRSIQNFNNNGDVVPLPTGAKKGRKRILDEEDEMYVEAVVEQGTDNYLDEFHCHVTNVLEKDISLTTLWRTMQRLNITNKQLTRPALERSMGQRMEYLEEISQYTADQLVFTDESYCDKRNTARLTGWSKRGTKAVVPAPFKRGRRYSILPALSLDGILDIVVIEGAVNTNVFMEFINGLLMEMQPYPSKNSVLVMDNVKFHLAEEVFDMIQNAGMRIVFLPPYSPDLNPIETAFGCTKAWIRRNNVRVREAMESPDKDEGIAMITMAVMESCTPAKALEWFQDSGYY